ncbi:MAG: nuclear transport factor 2 family protein [Planctomycetes bacterium]|nr:nuclear transport factor 2 family protein [Planctomycetota bacterium]
MPTTFIVEFLLAMRKSILLLAGIALLTLPGLAQAQPEKPAAAPSADEKAIRDNAAAYAAAFNSRDAKAMAAFWSPEAVYTNRLTGEQVVGKAAITKQIESQLKAAGKVILEVVVKKVEFVSPNVAIERGTTLFIPEKGTPDESNYTAVEVKRDGRWMLDRVTEDEKPSVPVAREKLQQLAWLVGSWQDESPEEHLETECHWARNENFLILSFRASIAGRTQMAGIQVIGYDAANKQFRSWVFDSDGGFGEGAWTQKGKQWFIHQKGSLPDGRTSSAVNVIRQLDGDSFTWQSTNREIDGRIEPNVNELRMVRQK